MLCPSSPNRTTQASHSKNASRAKEQQLRRGGGSGSQSGLKQVKLVDLFSNNNSSPTQPLPPQSTPKPSASSNLFFSSSPPSMLNVNTSTPCAAAAASTSSSCLPSDPLHFDVDSTDTDTDVEDHHHLHHIQSKSHNKRTRHNPGASSAAASVPVQPQQLPSRPYIRHVGGPKPNQLCPAFFPSLNKPLDGLRWRSAALHKGRPGTPHTLNAALDRSAYIASFKSHQTQDEYFVDRFHSDASFMAPPFACAFSHEAKRPGGKPLLAVASEEGVIQIMDTTLQQREGLTSRNTIHAHHNAIFDLKWSPDDKHLATSSGDQTIGVFDARTGQDLVSLSGHLCTTKCVQWDPVNPNILASGSRDGQIRVWDIRASVEPMNGSEEDNQLDSNINLVRNAHGLYTRRSSDKRTAVRSVTSLAYKPSSPHQIFSSGSADGVVKLWDLRRSMRRFVNPPPLAVSPDHSSSRGITCITVSPDSTTLYALSTSNHVLALDAHDITRTAPVQIYNATAPSDRRPHQGGQDADFRVGSFYVRLALSSRDQGRYLTAGSSDGSVWMWDTQTGQDVCFKGHGKEVGGLDCAWDAVASCSDDMAVRLWRPNNSWEAQSWLGVSNSHD